MILRILSLNYLFFSWWNKICNYNFLSHNSQNLYKNVIILNNNNNICIILYSGGNNLPHNKKLHYYEIIQFK